MNIVISTIVITLAVFLNVVESSSQTENGDNLDLTLRLGPGHDSEPRSQKGRGHNLASKSQNGHENNLGADLTLGCRHDSDLGLTSAKRHKSVKELVRISALPPGNHRILPKRGNGCARIPEVTLDNIRSTTIHGYGRPGITGIPHDLYQLFRLSEHIFYKIGTDTYHLITGPMPVVVRGNYIIGRFNNGFLRPIYNHKIQAIKIHKIDHHQLQISPSEYQQFGMDKPITLDNTINYPSLQPKLF